MASIVNNLSQVAETSNNDASIVVYIFMGIATIVAAVLLAFRDLFGSRPLRKMEKNFEDHIRELANQGDPIAQWDLAKLEASGGVKLAAKYDPDRIADDDAFVVEYGFNNAKSVDWTNARSTLIKAAQNGCVPAKEKIAVMLMERGEPRAGEFWRELAEREVPSALVTLGQGYLAGSHVLQAPREPFIAAKYFDRAAARGSAVGEYLLGTCYRQGLGVDQDFKRAFDLFDAAAQGGVPDAIDALASAYLTGEGVEVNHEKGTELLYAASALGVQNATDALVTEAERDNPDALNWLAIACENGQTLKSVATERVYTSADAESLFLRAAQIGDAFAMTNLGLHYEKQKLWEQAENWYAQGVAQNSSEAAAKLGALYLTKRYRATHGDRAVELLRQACDANGGKAANALAQLYARGEFVPQSDEEAFKHFLIAAEQGEPEAISELGERFWKGKGTPVDLDQAITWLSRAVMQGDKSSFDKLQKIAKKHKSARAAREVGLLLLRCNAFSFFATGAPELDPILVKLASTWFRKAAKWGDARSMIFLGDAIATIVALKRRGAKKLRKALQWYRRAAELGESNAMKTLGDCYRLGLGTPINDEEAVKRYDDAAALDNSDAILALADSYYQGLGVTKDVEKARELARRAAEAGHLGARQWLDFYECDPQPDPLARPARQEEFLTSL